MLLTYVKDETLMPLCITQSSQEIVCTNESKHARNLVGRVKLFPSIENVSIDNSTIESILLSNCEKHTKAIQKVHNSVKHFPTLSTYRFLYAEILSRSSSQDSLMHALEEITIAVTNDNSVILYREKKLSVLIFKMIFLVHRQ
ncbi:unnamed protein product [Heterobilharzia americana]|nr:unnamed protein product [Heterobilharzia americana]